MTPCALHAVGSYVMGLILGAIIVYAWSRMSDRWWR